MNDYILGVDVGTSSCKIAVFDADGNVVKTQSRDYPVYYPKPESNAGKGFQTFGRKHQRKTLYK